jgi:hypothetical protein
VEKTINTTKIDEYTEVGHVLDNALQYLTFLKVSKDRCLLLLKIFLNEDFVRYHYVIIGVVDLHNFYFNRFIYVNVEISDRLHIDL